ncbi:unnamed protein product [Parascedosporium putredinis]|uniref:Peptidase A1 domain-containing protein n=1 Tax=Parascedosporium putredinis TaxID=1442378 RepID=A0A9P1M713_9PEZI|nr:unnamed protein product [Parascedosporium putredinis]CAI7987897.1 unnamed protein product [Parascedosporium putredinis]
MRRYKVTFTPPAPVLAGPAIPILMQCTETTSLWELPAARRDDVHPILLRRHGLRHHLHRHGRRRPGPHIPRAVTGDGFISLPISRTDKMQNAEAAGIKPRSPFEVVLDNLVTYYTIEISLGNPAQNLAVLIDTGSSDLWVIPSCDDAVDRRSYEMCQLFGTYDPANSRTVSGPVGRGSLHYGDSSDASTQTSVTLNYFKDSLAIGDVTLADQIFGVIVNGTVDGISGILGLGPDLRDGFTAGKPYSLVLNSMQAQGFIKSRSFSIDLRHAEDRNGAVIFGGLDVKKFTGPLASFPMVPGLEGEPRLAIHLSTIGVSRSRRVSHVVPDGSNSVLLDSGTTLTRLHPRLAQAILTDLDATMDDEGFFLAACSMRSSASTVDFGFGELDDRGDPSFVLRVPVSDFVLNSRHYRNPRLCYVGLRVTEHQQILGDSVMRGGYFVFDWDNQQVHVAQSANCGTEILAIGTGQDAVPASEGKCDPGATGPAEESTGAGDGATPLPTGAFTTTFTITSCPTIDTECTPGMLTTQTFLPLETSSSDPDDEDAAGGRYGALNLWILFAAGMGAAVLALR